MVFIFSSLKLDLMKYQIKHILQQEYVFLSEKISYTG